MATWALLFLSGIVVGGAAAWFLRARTHAVLEVFGDGLDSLREHDYAVRVDEARSGSLSPLAARFNALAAALRSERNDVYQKELLLETVLETAPTAILVCDEQEKVVIANTAARDLLGEGRRLTGFSFSEVLGRCAVEVQVALRSPEDTLFTLERNGETEAYMAVSRWFE